MVIALVIISILLLLSLLFNIFFLKMIKQLSDVIIQINELSEELAFSQGTVNVPEEAIAHKFLNATIICYIKKNPVDGETWKIIDVSSYEKNHIIGLTYFVQPQIFEDIKSAIGIDQIKDKIRPLIEEALRAEAEDDDEEVDEEFIDSVIEQAYEEIMKTDYLVDEENGEMIRPPIPHCTVYQLKDGRWLWRPQDRQ